MNRRFLAAIGNSYVAPTLKFQPLTTFNTPCNLLTMKKEI